MRWGNLRRTAPLSSEHALDRGLPVDRHYIAEFLTDHAVDVRGDVMEMSRSTYTDAYGGARVTSVTIVDIDRSNEQATRYCDLCEPGSLPADAFDCIVFTQTLQYLADLDTAIENLWRALRPGAVLLLTVPAASRVAPVDGDYWRFTPAGLAVMLRDRLPAEALVTTSGRGNSFAVAAQVVAASVEDVGRPSLVANDPAYPVVAMARVVKPAARGSVPTGRA